MRLTTAGTALLLATVVPAVVVSSSSAAMPAPLGAVAPTTVTRPAVTPPTTVLPLAAGPIPSSWEGGHRVPVAPRWWPGGYSRASASWSSAWPKPVEFSPTKKGRLSGLVIALDPGHDIGNGSHISAINKTYWVGLTKTCNTTGTATNAGYPEATYNFDVVARLRRLLVAQGATVVVTRDRNTTATYGPCIGARGALPSQEKASFMVQVHADGAPSTGRGFHIIAPANYKGYTDDIYAGSAKLAKAMVAGMLATGLPRTTYLSSVIQVRKDTGAINMSNVPTITVETLNMRNASDAARAMSTTGRQKVALGLYAGILRYTGR